MFFLYQATSLMIVFHLVHPEPRRIPIAFAIPSTWKSFIHKGIRQWIPKKTRKNMGMDENSPKKDT